MCVSVSVSVCLCVGTFHLIHMLMDDYLLHLLETQLEKLQQKDFEKKILALKNGKKGGPTTLVTTT